MIAAVGVGEECLAAAGGPLDRTANLARAPRDEDLFGIVKNFRAKAAAHIRRHHAHLVLGQTQDKRRHQQANDVGVLRRGVERVVVARAVVIANGAARLNRVGDEPLVVVLQRGDVRGAGQGRVRRRLIAELPVKGRVIGHVVEQLRRALGRRLGCRDDRVQNFVLHGHQLGGVRSLLAALGQDDGDRVADVAHLGRSQHRMGRLLHGVATLEIHLPAAGQAADASGFEVGTCENGDHAIGCGCGRCIDVIDRGVGMRAAHERRKGRVRQGNVIGVAALAGDKALVFDALDGLSYDSHSGLLCALGGVLDRLDDVVVARAAAKVAFERVANLRVAGRCIAL